MKLIEVVNDLVRFDLENTIYASEPWSPDSEAIVAPSPESKIPTAGERLQMKYFLEVFIARDFLDEWTASLEKPPT